MAFRPQEQNVNTVLLCLSQVDQRCCSCIQQGTHTTVLFEFQIVSKYLLTDFFVCTDACSDACFCAASAVDVLTRVPAAAAFFGFTVFVFAGR